MVEKTNLKDLMSIDFYNLEEFEIPIPLSKNNRMNSNHHAESNYPSRFQYVSEKDIEEKLNSSTPENTTKKVAWAVKLFR